MIHFDGLCEPNPGGVSCYGWIIQHGPLDFMPRTETGHGFVRQGPGSTNNVAEYFALGHALKHLLDAGYRGRLEIRGDSKLVIEQLSGRWKCQAPLLVPLRQRCLALIELLGNDFSAIWIPRAQNAEADELSRKAYRQHTGKEPLA
jgi:ribonuclease HI